MLDKKSLPNLPFGDKFAAMSFNVNDYRDSIAGIAPSIKGFEAIGAASEFACKCLPLRIKNLSIIASANTPVELLYNEFNEVNLVIPFWGSCTTTMDNKSFQWAQNDYAILMPNVDRKGISNPLSYLIIDLKREVLENMARNMLGLSQGEDIDLKLNEPRLVPLKYGSFSFDIALRQIYSLIDSYECSSELLEKLGIDDLFYRNVVMMLLPEQFFSIKISEKTTMLSASKSIKLLNEYASAYPDQITSISEMESFLRMSSRSMQYTFSKVLNTTPSLWLRQHKMRYARQLLCNSGEMNVTSVALRTGFTSFSLFAKYYKEAFGELPSETLERAKKYS